MKTTKNIALIKFVLLLFLGLVVVPLHATTTLNASQTALRFEPLANVIRLSDDVAIAGSTYTKLGTIEDVYVTENNLSKLKTVEIYKNTEGVLAWRVLAQGEDIIYHSNYAYHLTDVISFSQTKAITGGHNFQKFNTYLSVNNIPINILETIDGSIDGISMIRYQIQKADGSGWKSAIFQKTLYDPAIFTDAQMVQFGKEAMIEGIQSGRIFPTSTNTLIKGEASNGIKFIGYKDPTTEEILNFHPIINY